VNWPVRFLQFIAILFWFVLLLSGSISWAKVPDASEHQLLVQGLRSRGLYDLADIYCVDMLQRKGIGLTLQADLVVEQILTRTALAMSVGDSTDEGWDRVVFPGRELLVASPDHPRRFLVQLQMALAGAARAKSVQQQVRFGVRQSGDLSLAINFYEDCRRNLEQLQREIAQAIPRALQRPPSGDELSPDRLQSLSASVNYQLASCLTEIAGMYQPDDRLNRIDALNMVLERVEQVRRQTGVSSVLNQACELLKVEALQLSGNAAVAQRELQKMDARKLAPENLQRYWQLELQLLAGATPTVESEKLLLAIGARSDNDPETEIAVLQFLVQQFKADRSATRLEPVRTWADRVQSRFGTAWGRFANRLLLEAAGESVAGTGAAPENGMAVDLALRAAENALAEKRTAEAIDAFRTAAAKLESNATDDSLIRQAFQIRVRVAELLAGQNDYPAAARELQAISIRFVSHELAPAVHLRAVWYTQRLVLPGQPETAKLYLDFLQEQVEHWNKSPSTDQARLWRASLYAADRQWNLAVTDCLVTNPAGDLAAAAAGEISRILANWFASVEPGTARSEGMQLASSVGNYAGRARASGNPATINAGWKLHCDFCALGLRFGFLDAGQVRSILEQLASTPEIKADPATINSGLAVLAAAEVFGRGSADRLRELLDRIKTADGVSPAELEFQSLVAGADRDSQEVGLLRGQLESANRLAKSLASGDQLDSVLLNAAQLQLALKEYGPAVALLEPLARALPDRMDVQLATARGISAIDSRRSDAINAWRLLSTRLAPQTEPWFESKHEIARLVLLSGKPGEARQILEFLNAVPPGWKNSKWAGRLDLLLKKCREAENQ